MKYLESRTKQIKELHEIYNKSVPNFIKELINAPELLRLSGISQTCGVERTGFGIIPYKYSRLDHSLGAALILDNFVNDKKQIYAGLLHDIASPTFAHTIDFLNKDYITQESTENKTYDVIISSDIIFEYLLKNEMDINDVCNDSKYQLANNEKPKLCADRLEYLLSAVYLSDICNYEEIKEIYNDLVVVPNEDNMPEFCFETKLLGKKFCNLSIKLGKIYSSYEAKYTMQYIADLIKLMISREEICVEDLYKYTDSAIFEIGKGSSDKRISDGWCNLYKLSKIYTRFTPIENKYMVKLNVKKRYVDPLVKTRNGYYRVSNIYKDCQDEINGFLENETDLYCYTDFDLLI